MRCPNCNSENIRYREYRNNYICDDCDHVFMDEMNDSQRIFISYGHDEYTDFAHKLADSLTDSGYKVFIDRDGIHHGEQWEINLEDGLNWTNGGSGKGLFLLIMTPYSVRRPDGYCLNEIAYALDINLKIIPIMLKKVTPPLSIYRLQYYNLPTDPNDGNTIIQNSISKIIELLKDPNSFDTTGDFQKLEKKLKPIDFNSEIKMYSKEFVGRDWIFSHINKWLQNKDKVLLITGSPGIGKSAISIYLYQRMPNIMGFYMFRRDDNDKLYFKSFVTTIAYQMASQIPEYREMLNKIDIDRYLDQYENLSLFSKLISIPLLEIECSQEKIILIDGLDEAERNRQNYIATAIATLKDDLPQWIKIVILTRPVNSVQIPLYFASKLEIQSDSDDNIKDLRLYVENRLGNVRSQQAKKIIEQSEGSFLYAKYACKSVLSNINYDLPSGLVAFYYSTFRELFKTEDEYNNSIKHILGWIIVSTRPISPAFIIGGIDSNIDEFRFFKNRMRPFLKINSDKTIKMYHSSLTEWLGDEMLSGEFWIDIKTVQKRVVGYIDSLINDKLRDFIGLEDYKKRRNELECEINMKIESQLFMLYLDLIVSIKDWVSFVKFASWYIGSVPSSYEDTRNYISDIQDQYYSEIEEINGNNEIYAAWESVMRYFVETCTERMVVSTEPYFERPVTITRNLYFVKDWCLNFIKPKFSPKSLTERCEIFKRVLGFSKYEFMHTYSLHEDDFCSMFVDEMRHRLYAIYETEKIVDQEINQWLEQFGTDVKW